jgi:hypothetical protein
MLCSRQGYRYPSNYRPKFGKCHYRLCPMVFFKVPNVTLRAKFEGIKPRLLHEYTKKVIGWQLFRAWFEALCETVAGVCGTSKLIRLKDKDSLAGQWTVMLFSYAARLSANDTTSWMWNSGVWEVKETFEVKVTELIRRWSMKGMSVETLPMYTTLSVTINLSWLTREYGIWDWFSSAGTSNMF